MVFFLESKTPPTLQITKMIVPNELTETLREQSGHKAAELQVLPELAGLCPLSPFFCQCIYRYNAQCHCILSPMNLYSKEYYRLIYSRAFTHSDQETP